MSKHVRMLGLGLLLAVWGTGLAQGQYSRPGLYEADYLTLENGLRVVLKPMDTMHTTSIRLAVKFGSLDKPCEKRETPHFLEHLLFTGTSRHSEQELDALIESHGGYWNAGTGQEYTSYDIDIYDKHTDVALDVLHEILTDSTLSEENVTKSRDIIRQELNGGSTWLKRLFARYGIGDSGMQQAVKVLYPDQPLNCHGYDTLSDITREDILKAYEQYYVASNMLLVVVGNFDRNTVYQQIKATFGQIPAGSANTRKMPVPTEKVSNETFSGNFEPMLESTGSVNVLIRSRGLQEPNYYAYDILLDYLDTRLFNIIRVEHGLAYGPTADHIVYDNFGVFMIGADASLDKLSKVRELVMAELDKLAKGEIDWEKLETARQSILMSLVHSDITHDEIANYYSWNYYEITHLGYLDNYETRIEQVSQEEILAAGRYLGNTQNHVIVEDRPTLTYKQLYVMLGLFCILLIWSSRKVYLKIKNLKQKQKLF